MGIHQTVKKKAVFLDRDGVINRAIVLDGKPYPPTNMEELEILPGVLESLKILKSAGFLLIVVSNQPDVAKGKITQLFVESVNARLKEFLPIDQFRICYHADEDGCSCRKPLPGLIMSAARELDIDLSRSVMIGDRWRDVEAGFSAGCKTFFINYGYLEKKPDQACIQVQSLAEACPLILSS